MLAYTQFDGLHANFRFDGTPESWIWEPLVPEHLVPWQGQRFHVAGQELWDDVQYVLLDWRDGSGRLTSRYVAVVMWCWDQWRGGLDETLPWMPQPGKCFVVTEARPRPLKWDHLVLCHGHHDGRPFWWKMKIQGCYRPPPPPPRPRSLVPRFRVPWEWRLAVLAVWRGIRPSFPTV